MASLIKSKNMSNSNDMSKNEDLHYSTVINEGVQL
jgi:hypothetical protein